MARLTAAAVEKLKARDKRQEIPDGLVTGLYLTVQPSGKKAWHVRYRAATAHRRMTLGGYPLMSLAEARDSARVVLRAALEGRDPAAERADARVAAAHPPERDTVAALIDQFDRRHLSTLKSRKDARQTLDRFVVATWGERDVHTITRRDVRDLLDGIVDSGRGVTANRALAQIRSFFGWLVERDVLEASPAAGVRAPFKETSRDRVLTDEEIRLFWIACDQLGQPWGSVGKLLLLTGQRVGEVTGMTDDEIRGDLWCLPAERTKNARAHTVPLSGPAVSVMSSMERIEGSVLVHTLSGEAPITNFNRGRCCIAERMEAIASAEAGCAVSIPHWTAHDLRRTCATGLARLGIPVRTTEAVLNHVSGTGSGIVAVYQRHDYADEKRQALEAWGRFVLSLVEGRADNVVRIAEARNA